MREIILLLLASVSLIASSVILLTRGRRKDYYTVKEKEEIESRGAQDLSKVGDYKQPSLSVINLKNHDAENSSEWPYLYSKQFPWIRQLLASKLLELYGINHP